MLGINFFIQVHMIVILYHGITLKNLVNRVKSLPLMEVLVTFMDIVFLFVESI